MKKFLFVSFLVHFLLTASFVIKQHQEDLLLEEQKQAEEKKTNSGIFEVNIVEVANYNTDVIKEKPKYFYWGIGVSVSYEDKSIATFGKVSGYLLTEVYQGYCGESSGLQVGDFIYLLDGKYLSDNNEIMGYEPKTLYLTILNKNGNINNISIERCKVYF